MGKIHSKQVSKRTAPEGECFSSNTKVTSVKDLVDAINSDSSFSEAFAELGESKSNKIGGHDSSKIEITDFMEFCGQSDGVLDPLLLNIPLRVTLPPLNTESNLLKLLTVDRSKKEDGSIETDTTDNNHGSEKSVISKGEENDFAFTAEEANAVPELQEWLFTLYDFDDLGKITKEDIVGLLKSLYDTVGSVITLQQQGARVLKLHLTVVPGEKSKCPDAKRPSGTSTDAKFTRVGTHEQFTESTKLNDCAKGSTAPNDHHCCTASKKVPKTRCPPLSHFHTGSPRTSGHRPMENRPITACGKDKRPTDTGNNASNRNDVRNFRGISITRRQSFSGVFGDEVRTGPAADGTLPAAGNSQQRQQSRQQCSGAAKRLSQFDERHLAHLIQQNMELNDQHQQHQQHSRRLRRHHNRKLTRDSRANQSRTCAVDCQTEESTQRRNYYLDLAGIENYGTSNDFNLVSSAQQSFGVFGDEESTRPQRKLKSKSSPSTTKHSRHVSGRTDVHGTDTIREEDETISANFFESVGDEPTKLELPSVRLKNPVPHVTPTSKDVEAVSSSHYHRRHRHRERNQNRAMKQVAEWIEREHVYHKTENHVVVVQRHEHHHIHEHFHHHIHHSGNS